jgi:hypothetical protein
MGCTRLYCKVGLAGLGAISVMLAPGASAQETTKALLASQIRDQGYRCNKAISAKKDLKRSKADEAVWVLRCDDGTYRIRLVPDMAAQVQRLK